MTARSSQFRLFSLAVVLAMLVPLLFGCTPAAPAATTAPAAPAATTAPAAPAATTAPAASAATTAPAAPVATTAPAAKKVFNFGRYEDSIGPDPVMNDANADIWYMQQYYSGLTRFTPDDTKVEPDLPHHGTSALMD